MEVRRETSLEAWKSIHPFLGKVDAKIVELIRRFKGLTSDEIELMTLMKHQTVSAQIRHLSERGILEPSAGRRKTRSGRNAIVWVEPGVPGQRSLLDFGKEQR